MCCCFLASNSPIKLEKKREGLCAEFLGVNIESGPKDESLRWRFDKYETYPHAACFQAFFVSFGFAMKAFIISGMVYEYCIERAYQYKFPLRDRGWLEISGVS